MKIRTMATLAAAVLTAALAVAETQVIDGRTYECRDGVCSLVEKDKEGSYSPSGEDTASPGARLAQGYMSADEFIAFLQGRESEGRERLAPERGMFVLLLLVLLGGLAMNLTPCVLPMIPINLMIVGRSARRGLAYGLGIALAYGFLGVAAAFGGLAFGTIQGSPWFNAVVAIVFAGLALALFDVWFIDLSRFRRGGSFSDKRSGDRFSVFAFGMGAMSAVLAGACVAPVLISVLLLTADLVAKGHRVAVALPFVMGLGMALPWPFAGAGLKVLPKPGAWMKGVNRLFGVVVLGFAAWYGLLAWKGFSFAGAGETPPPRSSQVSGFRSINVTPSTLRSQLSILSSKSKKPILVDCWATWCKNCAAMDRVMEEAKVKKALESFTVLRVQAEDISELRKQPGFESVSGLPAFVIFE